MVSPTSKKDSLLLSIPAEIRIMIFSKLLILRNPIFLPDPLTKQNNREWLIRAYIEDEQDRHRLALIYVNRQLHAEASDIFYSCNTFHLAGHRIHDIPLVITFLSRIGRSIAARLSDLTIEFPYLDTDHLEKTGDLILNAAGGNVILRLMQACTHLKILVFTLHRNRATECLASGIANNLPSARQLISDIDRLLKTNITTLKKIYIDEEYCGFNTGIRSIVEEYGWLTPE